MCIAVFAYKAVEGQSLVLLANRDEFYQRPTKDTFRWTGYGNVFYAGKDLEKGGTWLGVEPGGRFAFLTNHRNPKLNIENPVSRGQLIVDFLQADHDPEIWLRQLSKIRNQYNPFNIILGSRDQVYSYGSTVDEIRHLEPGFYGVSNDLLDTPWPKLTNLKKSFKNLVAPEEGEPNLDPAHLVTLLLDDQKVPDDQLPETGVGREWESLLSPVFIRSPLYGTRTSQILLIPENGTPNLTEYQHSAKDSCVSVLRTSVK